MMVVNISHWLLGGESIAPDFGLHPAQSPVVSACGPFGRHHHRNTGDQRVGFRHLPARHPHTRRYPILSFPPRLAFPWTALAGYCWPMFLW